MSFRERLQRATERGKQAAGGAAQRGGGQGAERRRVPPAALAVSAGAHRAHRKCLRDLADNFPGFRLETIVDESGWGAAVSRDDVGLAARPARQFFSRLQLVVSPYSKYHVLDMAAQRHGAQQGSAQPQSLSATGRCRSRKLPRTGRAVGARLRGALLGGRVSEVRPKFPPRHTLSLGSRCSVYNRVAVPSSDSLEARQEPSPTTGAESVIENRSPSRSNQPVDWRTVLQQTELQLFSLAVDTRPIVVRRPRQRFDTSPAAASLPRHRPGRRESVHSRPRASTRIGPA